MENLDDVAVRIMIRDDWKVSTRTRLPCPFTFGAAYRTAQRTQPFPYESLKISSENSKSNLLFVSVIVLLLSKFHLETKESAQASETKSTNVIR